jgi:pimeloyl-ACP methyl ester carboxylesterase
VSRRVRELPRRFRSGAAIGLSAEWELRVGQEVFTIAVAGRRCSVREGVGALPEATIIVDPDAWLAMDAGSLSGIDAFLQGRLRVRGSLDLAVRVQTLFRPHGRPRRTRDLEQVEVRAAGVTLSSYLAGAGETMLLLHGLGGSKVSWLPVVAALGEHFRVVAPDLPGHGESGKPGADYSPRFYAGVVRGLMDTLETRKAVVVGNSLGGRVALDLALHSPTRVSTLALLGPVVPGLRWRHLVNLSRLVPAEVGGIPFPLRERWMRTMVRRMFAHPERMPPELFTVVAQEFMRVYRDPRARVAFFSSLRHIVTEPPGPFWASLAKIEQPSIVLFGESDRLVPLRLGAGLADRLPNASFRPLPGVGHVPQVEAPRETLAAILEFVGRRGVRSGR